MRSPGPKTIRLRLFVAGGSLPRSRDAVAAAQDLVGWLEPRGCELEIIDVLDEPAASGYYGMVVTPFVGPGRPTATSTGPRRPTRARGVGPSDGVADAFPAMIQQPICPAHPTRARQPMGDVMRAVCTTAVRSPEHQRGLGCDVQSG